jgi:hypothetical protein
VSFQPILPLSGYGGWRFLNRTLETQQAAFQKSPAMQRDTAHFRERIAAIDSAEALVADRRLLRVALGAFGLEEDINNRAFLRKILEGGTTDPESLANRLADKRYFEFSKAFGFGEFEIRRNRLSGFADDMIKAYQSRQFEVAVGRQDESMRLALGLRRDLAALAGRETGERAKWFSVMGNPPLRRVFETAFGLPKAFAGLDLDRQLAILQERTRRAFGGGDVSQFADPVRVEELAQRFLLRADLDRMAPTSGSGSVALQLIQAAAANSRNHPAARL